MIETCNSTVSENYARQVAYLEAAIKNGTCKPADTAIVQQILLLLFPVYELLASFPTLKFPWAPAQPANSHKGACAAARLLLGAFVFCHCAC